MVIVQISTKTKDENIVYTQVLDYIEFMLM